MPEYEIVVREKAYHDTYLSVVAASRAEAEDIVKAALDMDTLEDDDRIDIELGRYADVEEDHRERVILDPEDFDDDVED